LLVRRSKSMAADSAAMAPERSLHKDTIRLGGIAALPFGDSNMATAKRVFAILGSGNMAEGILTCALDKKVLKASDVRAADPIEERRRLFAEKFAVRVTADNAEAARGANVVLLSVKPQTFHAEAPALAAAVCKDCCVISIMAGITTATIEQKLGGAARVIRAMPNLPIRLAAGVAGVCKGRFATDEDMAFAMQLFAAGGGTVALEDEALIDAVTAVSGSGPAYFYYFVEAMTEAGVELGLPRKQALVLAKYTCLGAGRMMVETGEDPAILRQKVSSKGGTTLAALEVMEKADVKGKIQAAVKRAFERARELGRS
jgi:pyrroline-5-carboxylate reductase